MRTVKRVIAIVLIVAIIIIGVLLSVFFTRLYINSGMRGVIFYKWIPIPLIILPAITPVGATIGISIAIREKLFKRW
jgi:hypothetical protein